MIVEYIEKYVCPTITSGHLRAARRSRFAEDKRPNVVFVVWEDEYHAAQSLTGFADLLRDRYGCRCTVLVGEKEPATSPGCEELDAADLMVLFARRKALPKQQMDRSASTSTRASRWWASARPATPSPPTARCPRETPSGPSSTARCSAATTTATATTSWAPT